MVSELSCVQVPREESKEDSASQQPWLLITDGENYHIQNNMFNHKPLHNCYYDVGGEIPEFLGRVILCSCGEWVLLSGSYDDGLPHVLVNLLTRETIELPLMDFNYDSCILTSPPSDPTCNVVFFKKGEKSLIIWQPGGKEFAIKNLDIEIFVGTAVVAGKLFFDIMQDRKVVLAMVEFKESTYPLELVRLGIEFMSSWRHYFFEYLGELFAVYKIKCGHYSSNLAGFKIFKADLLNKKWVRVPNLGRLAIFIGYSRAHCAAVDSGIATNSVYFLEKDDRDSYYVYNLEEGTVRMKPMFYSIETTKYMMLEWIMMPCDPPFHKLLKEDQEIISQDSENENGVVEQDGVQESWNMVPHELLNLIQLYLFGRDHAVFRGVCKSWQQTSIQDYSIPSIPPLLSSTELLEQCQSSYPLLMSEEDTTSSYDGVPIFRFFDPVHRKLYRTRIPELKEAEIQYSRDGWLLLWRHRDKSMFFFNPLTREKIELPSLPPHRLGLFVHAFTDLLSFSSPPTCSNCLVVGVDHYGMSIYTLKHGDENWRIHDFDYIQSNGEEDVREYRYNIVGLNGLHYFMCENRDMVIFKVYAEDQIPDREICRSKFRRSPYRRGEDFLVEIDGGPAFISVSPNGGEISISKWNDVEKDWELMEGGVEFGGKEMFVSKRCWFMEKIDDVGGMGNNIFLPMIDDAKVGVFYSLATRKYHTLYSGYSSKLPYHVDKLLNGIWVQPDRKVVGRNNLKWFV